MQLAPTLARAVAEMGYESMTPIQAQAIPVVLAGQDVMGAAQTGTGKTAAFSLPLLQRMLRHENSSTSPARHPVRALVLLPTRELADQVAQQIKLYAKYTQLRSTVVFGGMDMKPQTLELKKGVEVLVATPGRLLDHIEAKNAVLNQVEYVVLDEADRMLDIGFLPDLQRILSYLPKQRTTLLFSATFSPEIKRLAEEAAKSASRAAERQTKSLAEPILRREASVPAPVSAPPPEAWKKYEESLDAYESAVKAYEANPTPETERKAKGAESRAKGPAQNAPELKKRYADLLQRFERAKADAQKAHDKAEATRDGLMKRLDDRMRGVKSARTEVTLLWQRNPTPIALRGREDKVQGEIERLQAVIRDTKEKVSQIEPEDRALLNFKIREAEKLVTEQQKVSESNYAAFKEIKPVLGIKGGRRRMKRKSTRRYVA